jgi:hypothetical protein
MLFQSTVHRYVGGKQIVGSGEWGKKEKKKKKKKKINCGVRIKMAKGCGQVARTCNSDVAVTMIG